MVAVHGIYEAYAADTSPPPCPATLVKQRLTVVSFAAGLVVYAPWLIVLLGVALVPSFLSEALSYALSTVRTPQRRELDYVRQVAASADTAKGNKVFGSVRSWSSVTGGSHATVLPV